MIHGRPAACAERLRLINEYCDAVNLFANFVTEMRDFIADGLDSEAQAVRQHMRVSWDTVEKARVALFRHEVDHSCNLN